MAQAVSHRPHTAEARVRSHADPSGRAACGRSLTMIVGLNPTGGVDVCVVFVVRTVIWNIK